jgi:hypothetical protein
MRQISIAIFGLLTILVSCRQSASKETTDSFQIPDPRLVDVDTADIVIRRAIIRTRDYLTTKERDTNINDFYLDSLYVKTDTVILLINHADYYVEWRQMMEELKRQKELRAKGDSTFEFLYGPPAGNWSGKDRAILYLTDADSIIDVLYQ